MYLDGTVVTIAVDLATADDIAQALEGNESDDRSMSSRSVESGNSTSVKSEINVIDGKEGSMAGLIMKLKQTARGSMPMISSDKSTKSDKASKPAKGDKPAKSEKVAKEQSADKPVKKEKVAKAPKEEKKAAKKVKPVVVVEEEEEVEEEEVVEQEKPSVNDEVVDAVTNNRNVVGFFCEYF